jgi:hypothetical protein
MSRCRWIIKVLMSVVVFSFMTTINAGGPVWSVTQTEEDKLNFPAHVSLSANGSAIIKYQVTNNSRKLHTLVMTPIPGISASWLCLNATQQFPIGYKESCILTLNVTANELQHNVSGGPVICQQGSPLQCYQPDSPDSLHITTNALSAATLTASVSTLALATNGEVRKIIITNNGPNAAVNVNLNLSPALPAGTTIAPSFCATIAPGGTCVLSISPGSTPSAAPGDNKPTPITLTVAGDNTNTLVTTINILTYGSMYQSGYVFAIDDSTPDTTNIGGKVATLQDQVSPITGLIWSSNGSGGTSGDVANDNIPGILETSVAPPCNGNTEGICNTELIVAFYPIVNLSFYAAGQCKIPIDGYSDWYLPAICEMGYDATASMSGCGTQLAPTLQNMQSNLVDNGAITNLFGIYWSSTEDSSDPTGAAWAQILATGGVTQQGPDDKFGQHAVRCVRILTP